ncbi:MAG: hypothetical protein CMO38_01590 [Verrucomicrobiaceae bacterium]|nr:hypothetical protein [Verrucomicrobiaceae bacterium]
MKLLFTIFSSTVLHPLEKCSLFIFAVLTFTASQTIAEFGPQQIVTSTATDVMDAFPADMDGDGDIDILAAKPGNPFFGGGAAVLYRNNGNGSFTELTPFTNGPTTLVSNIVASDLDNDGDLDVVLGSSGTRSGGVRVYRNNGSLRFTRTFDNENAPYLWDIHLGDVNKDNRPDIIFGLGGSFDQIGIYLNSGNMFNWGGLIAAKTGISTGDEPRNIHLADIDGDGDQDVISANYLSNQISYYPNGGGVSVVRLTSSSQTRGPRNVRTGDINGDGRLDLISVSVLDGKVAWYNGTGNGRFGSQKIIHTYSTRSTGGGPDGSDALGPRGLDVADFDGDGDLDVFSTSEVGSTVCLHENLGGGSFGQAEIITNRANGVNLVTTIDMDGDGDLDVVSSSPGDNKIAWYETLGGGAKDSDGDGVNDDDDAFPDDPSETADSDKDGVGDNADAFPNDPTEVADCDNDGVGDNEDRRSPQIIAGLQSQITALQTQIDQLSQRPTIEDLQDARAGSLIINSNNGNITVKFDIEESEDLTLWKKTGESISKTIQLKDGKKFYRFAIDN